MEKKVGQRFKVLREKNVLTQIFIPRTYIFLKKTKIEISHTGKTEIIHVYQTYTARNVKRSHLRRRKMILDCSLLIHKVKCSDSGYSVVFYAEWYNRTDCAKS